MTVTHCGPTVSHEGVFACGFSARRPDGAHFASGDHLSFSIRNTEGREARVTRTQLTAARDEGWWGKPVTVNQDRILER